MEDRTVLHTVRHTISACLLVLLWLSPCPAQMPELTTDRPDQTESAETVFPGGIQVEIGWTHVENDDDGLDLTTNAFPQTLIRYGLLERFELRFGFDGYVWQDMDAADDSLDDEGAGDMEVGFKYKLWDEQGCTPQTALLVGTTLPTGEAGFSSERLDPSVRLACAHTLSETFSLGYNLAGIWETNEDDTGDRDTTASVAYSAVLGIALTDRAGTFLEFFGSVPTDEGKPANSIDTGLTYLVTENLQVDVLGGVGLSDDAEDWFIGAGVVYRTGGATTLERRRLTAIR